MTTEGSTAMQDNSEKYQIIREIIHAYRDISTILKGDIIAHIGLLGERVS